MQSKYWSESFLQSTHWPHFESNIKLPSKSKSSLLHTIQSLSSCLILEKLNEVIKTNVNPLSTNPTKWSNILKPFAGYLPTNCLSLFDHFVRLALRRLKSVDYRPKNDPNSPILGIKIIFLSILKHSLLPTFWCPSSDSISKISDEQI